MHVEIYILHFVLRLMQKYFTPFSVFFLSIFNGLFFPVLLYKLCRTKMFTLIQMYCEYCCDLTKKNLKEIISIDKFIFLFKSSKYYCIRGNTHCKDTNWSHMSFSCICFLVFCCLNLSRHLSSQTKYTCICTLA